MKQSLITIVALLVSILLAALTTPAVWAASLTVNSLVDADSGSDGVCTLREAITAANNNANYHERRSTGYGNDTITFSVGGTITLGSSLPNITDAAGLTINGGSAVTISGNNAVRVLQVNSGPALGTWTGANDSRHGEYTGEYCARNLSLGALAAGCIHFFAQQSGIFRTIRQYKRVGRGPWNKYPDG